MANSFSFFAAAAFNPATPPVFTIAATLIPVLIILPILFNRPSLRLPRLEYSDTT